MPLLQDMLEAAYYASGGEKSGPFFFRWPTARQLVQIQRRRDRQRVHRSRGETPATKRWREAHQREINRRSRVRYHASKETRERKAEAQRDRRADPRKRFADSERLSRRQEKQKEREKSRREFQHYENLRGLSLAEIERPTYRVEGPRGHVWTETWPLQDEAAAWLAQHNLAATDTVHGVIKPIDTAAEKAQAPTPCSATATPPPQPRVEKHFVNPQWIEKTAGLPQVPSMEPRVAGSMSRGIRILQKRNILRYGSG